MQGRGAGSAWGEDVAALRRGLQLAVVAVISAAATAGLVIAIGISVAPRAEPSAGVIEIAALAPAR
jgi:hypothetical protein